MSAEAPTRLRRSLGVPGAVVIGLSAMLGTGVFAVWTPALGLAGRWLPVALGIAAVVASANAISTARLAVRHPESGGAYAYGRLRLRPSAGVVAGYAFTIGKSASAAAAALTIGFYSWPEQARLVALASIVLALFIDLRGIVKSTRVSAGLAFLVMVSLLVVVMTAWLQRPGPVPTSAALPVPSVDGPEVLAAAGLLFVAFAGYARITVLGEEVRSPERTIPRAMVISFVVVLITYASVCLAVLSAWRAGVAFGPASLEGIAELAGQDWVVGLVRLGAILGAGSVLLSLLSGIGRTVFAMAAGGHAPRPLATVSQRSAMPARAAVLAAALAGLFVLPGRLGWALALSASSILAYYSVAHMAAWSLPGRSSHVVSILGLLGCTGILSAVLAAAVTGNLPGS